MNEEANAFAKRLRNIVVALVAIILAAALALGFRTQTSSASLATMVERSTPLEVALSNDKPTLMEFYADWCVSCQAMAPDIAELETEYGDRVNFVALNVDNSKWLPELTRYRVDGIPHFVYLNGDGEPLGMAVGEQPTSILRENLEAAIARHPLPRTSSIGRTSQFQPGPTPNNNTSNDPRAHGAQVP